MWFSYSSTKILFKVYQLLKREYIWYIYRRCKFNRSVILVFCSAWYGSRGVHSPHDWLHTRVHKKRRKGYFFRHTEASTSFAKRGYFLLLYRNLGVLKWVELFRAENGIGKQHFENLCKIVKKHDMRFVFIWNIKENEVWHIRISSFSV